LKGVKGRAEISSLLFQHFLLKRLGVFSQPFSFSLPVAKQLVQLNPTSVKLGKANESRIVGAISKGWLA